MSTQLLHVMDSIYVTEDNEFTDNIIIDRKFIHNTDGEHPYVKLTNSSNSDLHVWGTIGWPHFHGENVVFIPSWMIQKLGNGNLDDIFVSMEFHRNPISPVTHISFEPVYGCHPEDVEMLRSAIEETLDRFHILEEGSIIHTKKEIPILIKKTEPASIVRLGGEVDIHIVTEEQQQRSEPIAEVLPLTSNVVTEDTPEQRRETIRNSWLSRFKT